MIVCFIDVVIPDLVDYLVMKYPTPLVSALFGSVIPTSNSFIYLFKETPQKRLRG